MEVVIITDQVTSLIALQSIWPVVDMTRGRYGPLSVYMAHQDGRYGPPLVDMAHPLSILLRQ